MTAEVPPGWRVLPVRELIALDQPGTWGTEDGDVLAPVLRSTNLTKDGRLDMADVAYRSIPPRDRERRCLREGDIVLERSGGSPTQPVGRVIRIGSAVTATEIYCSNFCQQLRPDSTSVDSDYLYRVLWQAYEAGVTARLQHQTTGIRNLDYDAYLSHHVLIPPLPEQHAITTVLNTIDEAIKHTEAVIAAVEELQKTLLHDLLTHGLPRRHSAWEDVPGIGTIPACWDVATLGEVCEHPEYGAGAAARPYSPELPRYVRITDITDDGSLTNEDPRSADPEDVDGYELTDGDLLFARSGATVGKTLLFHDEHGRHVFAGYLIRFRALCDRAIPDYLEACTRSRYYERWVRSMLRAGAQPNINATEYASLPIPLPRLEEQQRIVDVTDAIRVHVLAERETLATLSHAKKALSDELLSGRVRVASLSRVLGGHT